MDDTSKRYLRFAVVGPYYFSKSTAQKPGGHYGLDDARID